MFQKTQKFKIQKKQIIFPLDYMNEHSMPNFGLLGGREAFPQMAIHFTKELPLTLLVMGGGLKDPQLTPFAIAHFF